VWALFSSKEEDIEYKEGERGEGETT